MNKRCGNCKWFIPADKPPADMVARARTKLNRPYAICQGDGKARGEEDKPCLIWMEAKKDADA